MVKIRKLYNLNRIACSFCLEIEESFSELSVFKILYCCIRWIRESYTLTAIDSIITPKIELVIRLMNESSGQDAASVTGHSARGERMVITASFENKSGRNNTFHEINANDGIWGILPDEVSELSVSRSHFDRQSITHHSFNTKHYHSNSSDHGSECCTKCIHPVIG